MTLSYNKNKDCFFVVTKDDNKARQSGLTKSTQARGANGESVYYTADYNKKPIYNPFAVLGFYDEADESAKPQLAQAIENFKMSWSTDSEYEPPAPPGRQYLPYQKAGVEYGKKFGNILIGDEPGLGKTIQAIGIANATGADKVLVICPASVRINWNRELLKWSTNPDINIQTFFNSKSGFRPDVNTAIFSYELAKNERLLEAILQERWDLLVIDEAHYLKSLDAQRTQAIFGGGRGFFSDKFVTKNVGRTVALTGTPLPNRPRECYTLARALCHESIDYLSYDKFCYRFNPSGTTLDGQSIESVGRLPELQARLRVNFMVRRLKKDVLKDLPDKRYEFTYLETNGKIKEVLQREKLLDFKISDLKNPFTNLDGMISTIRREMGEAKVPRIIEHMRYLLDVVEVPKVVMFCHHKSVMDALANALHEYGVVQVRGGMSSSAKDRSVQDFQTNPNVRIFEGQLDAAGFGIDGLQNVCDHVVFAEPAWTPGTNEQAVDRCHRIGQHSNVLAQFLVVEGSLDEKVLATVLEKNDTIHKTLDKELIAL